ncbi:hypothetical protein [Aquimarina mytili]|uniref:PKD domain-containing protein n=1 Tax=Aquimarina mytili TaxID=874423 RepID=A0A936ZRF6_9FLAO|nr:hypothetical protein [Aquimarina mytili]MBL0684269.1 hypothetical protein [Aquimarina mytili]
MKKLSIWLLSILTMLFVITSCEINEEFDRCPELAFTFQKLDSVRLDKVDDTISNDSLFGYYKFTADFPNIEETAYEWFVNDSLVDSELILDDRDNMYVGFFEPGIYNICIFSETPECPEGTSYCKTLRVGVTNPACPELKFITRTDTLPSGKVNYKFIADFEGIEEVSYGWFINGDLVEDSAPGEDNYLRWDFEKPGVYEVCIKTETPDCPEGTSYCEEVVVRENGNCPEISFDKEIEPGTVGTYVFEANIEGADEISEIIWLVNGEYVESPGDPQVGSRILVYQFENGIHEVCLKVITPDCPEGVKYCKEIRVGNCPDLFFEYEQDGDNLAYYFYPSAFDGIDEVTLEWFVNGDYVGKSPDFPHNNPFYYQFNAPGRYEVCLMIETPDCPAGTSVCKVIEIPDGVQE